MKCVFYSTYGYNTSIRDGKIYDFNKNTIKYLLEVNKDLILHSTILHLRTFKTPTYNK